MILGLEVTLFLYLLLASLYWLVRSLGAVLGALRMLVVCNVLLLYVANPVLFFYLAAQFLLVAGLYVWLGRRGTGQAGLWPWLSFIGLLPMNLQLWAGKAFSIPELFGVFGRVGMENVFWSLGASFFVIKSFVILKESLAERRFDTLSALAALTFLPSFSAGPIHGMQPWRVALASPVMSSKKVLEIFLKIGWGAAALFVLAPWLRGLAKSVAAHPLGLMGDMYLSFAALYFDFSGYSLLAIACAGMVGATLPENFNRPYLATSIREFWQRWHMSLSWFIGTYLFKPFVRSTGSARKGIFLAFVCAGLWHEMTPGYLLWGIGHGFALSLAMKPPALWNRLISVMPAVAGQLLSWFLTMTWVAALSFGATRWLHMG
jgi:D-alanyl-lipoteichoic acid acyltransferase DltB (MBOAT superfamily)